MKEMLAPLQVWMSGKRVVQAMQAEKAVRDGKIADLGNMTLDVNMQKNVEGAYHPLVRTHPVTGEKSLYVDGTYACGIEGFTEAESKPIIDFLAKFATQESFTCRLKWYSKTLIMWDNRICLHQAFNG